MPHGKCDTLCNVEQISAGAGLNQKDKTSFCIVTLIQICIPVKDSSGEGVWNRRYCNVKHTVVPWISGFIYAQLKIGKSLTFSKDSSCFLVDTLISSKCIWHFSGLTGDELMSIHSSRGCVTFGM